MIVALAYNHTEQEQATRLADWIRQLGSYPEHTLILATEKRVTQRFMSEMLECFGEVEDFEFVDHVEHYPESSNLAFQQCSLFVSSRFPQEKRWLYLEADAVPTRASWLNEIQEEANCGKPFCGALVPASTVHATPEHMGKVGVYPVDMIKAGAGNAMIAFEEPFPSVIAGVAVHAMKVSGLICHDIDGTKTPTSWALYHPDRDGRVLKSLSSVPVLAEADQPGTVIEPAVVEPVEARESTNADRGDRIDSRGGGIHLEDARPAILDLIRQLHEAAAKTTAPVEPWKDMLESEERIKALILELQTFCTTGPRIGYIRNVLKVAKIMPGAMRGAWVKYKKQAKEGVVVGRKRVRKINLHGPDKARLRIEKIKRKRNKTTGQYVPTE